MKEKAIRNLIRLVEESDIEQLEVTSWGRKVRITKRMAEGNGHSNQPAVLRNIDIPPKSPMLDNTVSPPSTSSADTESRYVEIKAPMVGTFYSAPAPDASPYVKPDQRIEMGQVVCIVEAMKLMNEIESETTGRVIKALVENGQPVEFGQVLFLVDPNG
jgi:acetyl-CoA carboxylase biotin carboxyl carrier protein